MERVNEKIKDELNSSELIEKFKSLGLEKGIKYKNVEFHEVEILEDKLIIKIKTE